MKTSMPTHPAADLFPMLPASELQALADDIKANGQHEPAVVFDGQVIDGRNRIAACALAGVEPRVRTLPSCPDPVAYVLSLNLHRRHLNEGERATVAAKALPLLSEQAKARQVAAGAHGAEGGRGKVKGDQETLSANLREGFGKAADQAAAMLNVSPRTVEAASKVLKHGVPELVEAMARGQVAVSAAAAVATLPAEEQREAVAGGKEAVREKAKAVRAAKAKAPTHPVLAEIEQAADLAALDRAFNKVAGAGLSEADATTAGDIYRRKAMGFRNQAAATSETPTPAPAPSAAAPPPSSPTPAPAPPRQTDLFSQPPAPTPPPATDTVTVSKAEWDALQAEVNAYRAWVRVVDQRTYALAPTIKGEANLERIRRLIETSGSPNENEARNAAFIACRMIRDQGVKLLTSDPSILDDIYGVNRRILDIAKEMGVTL